MLDASGHLTSMNRAFASCALLIAALCGSAHAQSEFPRSTVRILVPFAPGGAPDIMARTLGQKAAEGLGREIIVENRTGAGGNIAMEAGAHAPPDGHTLLMCTFGCATNPYLFDKLAWQPKDLAPVMLAGRVPNVLVVHPGLAVSTIAEFVAAAKAKQGGFSMASSGVGSASHLAGEMFRSMAGIDVLHVPYKGSTAALPDLAGGRVDFMVVSAPEALSFIKEGRLRALGSSSTRRASSLPDVPTIAESGLKDYSVTAWAMLVVPTGTPDSIIRRLNREFNAAVSDPDVRRRFDALSIEPGGGSPSEAAEFLRQQSLEWGKLIRALGIKAG
jgi:tripartite-type tricarboxylate transporter receptor subunit TctC